MMGKVCNILGTLIVVFIILFSLPFLVPKLFGYQVFAVASESMEPAYPVGCAVYVKKADSKDIRVGDVITYKMEVSSKSVTTHRVAEIDAGNDTFVTKGDANDTVDAVPVVSERIVGKVMFSIPFLGMCSQFVQTGTGAAACVFLFALAILLWVAGAALSPKKKVSRHT